jgi:hypothetical protein
VNTLRDALVAARGAGRCRDARAVGIGYFTTGAVLDLRARLGLATRASASEEARRGDRGLDREYVAGIGRRGERVVVLLDVERLVTSTERISMREAVFQERHHGE